MKLKQLPRIAIATLALASGLVVTDQARSQDLVYAGFDTDTQGAGYAWGIDAANLTAEWDGTVDSKTNSASGSLKFTVAWPATSNYQELNQSLNVAVPDLSLYDKFSMDVKVDPASLQTTNGNYGTVRVALRGPGYSWNGWLAEPTLATTATNGWYHYEYAFPATIPSIVQINVGVGGANYTGPITYWVDNLTFIEKTGPPPPPTLAIQKSGPGLEVVTCGGGDYSRKNIATANALNSVMSWLNSTGAVTYAMTINQAPGGAGATNLSGIDADHAYCANMWLNAGTMASVNASPDWNDDSGLFLEVKASVPWDGTYTTQLRYKTNSPGGHGIRWSTAGLLIGFTNCPTMVGTWALTMNQSSFTVTGPGGVSGGGTLPADVTNSFASPNYFFACFGAQPNTHKDVNISLSRVHIYGAPDFTGTVDQDFTTATNLDPNLQIIQEGAAQGLTLKPTNTAWRVSWGIPDSGLSLWSSPTVNSNDWKETGLTPVTQGATRAVFTTNSSSGAQFFQIRTASVPPAPPYLLESFESGSPFPAASSPYFNFEQSTAAGVTDGANSLHVSYTNDMTWSWRTSTDYGSAAYDAWKAHTKIVFDLHRAAFTAGWNFEMVVAIDGTMGWNQNQVVNWVWLNAGAETTQTITWDYSSISGAAPGTGSSFKLNLMLRGNGGDVNGHCGDVYIDNIRFEN